MQSLNQPPPKELNLPSNPHDIVEKFSCNSDSPDCMNFKCKECGLLEKLEALKRTISLNINEWKQMNCRAQKVSVSINVKDVSSRFNTYVKQRRVIFT